MGTTSTEVSKDQADGDNGVSDEVELERADKPAKKPVAARVDELFAAVRRLEQYATTEAKRVSGKIIPEVEERAKRNIWTSLLIALGLGVILGLLLGTGRRRRD